MRLEYMTELVVVLVVVAIVGAMGALVLSEVQDTDSVEDESFADNATTAGLDAVDTLMGFLPVVGIVVIAAVIIGIVANAFMRHTNV